MYAPGMVSTEEVRRRIESGVAGARAEVVDTTGAGDAFAGVLAAALDRGTDWPTALAEGVAAGSLACTTPGAQRALPDAAAIRSLAASVASKMRSGPLALTPSS